MMGDPASSYSNVLWPLVAFGWARTIHEAIVGRPAATDRSRWRGRVIKEMMQPLSNLP